ncbi:MAG: 1-acyl-sn-glycerol-3-phosphate acyltransferase [Myxococcales bacterium]|nr:1-acyl-sn-glycerol-3-phosphate acyltransferase [Myxococcales bacterium]
MRTFVEALCRLTLRIFFRRVDAVGLGNVPTDGPLVIVANHPNGLMDPLVLLTHSPRRVSFMSKEPLFRTPVVSLFVKALDCLPVYRKQDGADTGANRRTMEAARALLGRGGAIGIFPEGISHDFPELQPLKTGAARMALATQRLIADSGDGPPLRIQPAGLFFEDKAIFRSEAVVVWGQPIDVPLVAIDADAEPSRADTHALNEQIAKHLRALTPNAADADRVAQVARVARLLAAIEHHDEPSALPARMGDRLELMQRLLSGHDRADVALPRRLQAILRRIDHHESDLAYWGLSADHAAQFPSGSVKRSLVGALAMMAALSPFALVGLLINYPAYRLIGWAAVRFANNEEDVISTMKTLGGLVLFPLSWLIAAGAVGWSLGSWAGAMALVVGPMSAWAALHWGEYGDAIGSAARSLVMMLRRGDRHAALLAEQRAIVDELMAIEAALGESAA